MRFWDSSAIVPLLLEEDRSPAMTALIKEDQGIVVWWGTVVECLSALHRREREGLLSRADLDQAIGTLKELEGFWIEVQPKEAVRAQAARALSVHGLRTADSLQLGAALAWRPLPSGDAAFVSLDQRLARAASREGFTLAAPLGDEPG